MIEEALKLTVYFGERDRADGRFLADALVDLYERHRLTTSVMMRGIEGFGLRHTLHTDRFLTLSHDLPLISVAVDSRATIERLVPEARALMGDGLVSLERARMAHGDISDATQGLDPAGMAKLTVYAGRSQRQGARPAYQPVIELLRSCGLAGASVIPAVDGTRLGERRRARFFSRNVEVPLMLLALGTTDAITKALPELDRLFDEPVVTLERVAMLKRDGERLGDPHHLSDHDPVSGLPVWQKLTVHSEQQAKANGSPLHVELIRRLRAAGAAGATAVRAATGFYGDHEPFQDRLLALRRNVPIHTITIDTPDRARQWWPVMDDVTQNSGLITSEPVPASHATSRSAQRGGLHVDHVPPLPKDQTAH